MRIVFLSWLAGVVALGMLPGQNLPLHSVDVQLDFTPNTSASQWINGYLPKYSRAINGIKPTVWMLDKTGATVIPASEIWFSDAAHVEVRAVIADRRGNLYTSAEVWSGDGKGTGVICKVSPGKKEILVIRTDDFLAKALAVTGPGDIWAFGLPLILQTPGLPHRITTLFGGLIRPAS